MKRDFVLLFAVILSGAVACAPTAPATNVPVQPQPSSTAVANVTPTRVAAPTAAPTFAPNPLNVQVKVDDKFTASAVISTTGGTLTAQAADGTKFTLTFPKGALFSDEKITLTPITAVDGLPFSGGLVGGVQMAPEGLRLLQPATLTIESPKTVAAKGFETVAFAYHQNGEGMYLNPSDAKGNALAIEVWHFSGAGAAQGTSDEVQTQQQNVPSDCGDASTQSMREYLGRERQAQLLGQVPDPNLGKKMGEFLRGAYNSCIGPQLPTALVDCDAAPAILSKALGWLRQVQLLGYEKDFQPESALITKTMEQAIVNCYDKEYDQCVIDNDIKHRTTMLGFLRQAALLGIDGRLDQSKIEKCPRMSYQASGQFGVNGVWSGVACSLAEPFTIMALPPDLEMPFKFVPASAQAGTVSFDVTKFGTHWAGSGTYTVQGSSTDKLKIVGQLAGTYATNAGSGAYDVPLDIDLTSLGTSCK